MVQIAREEKMSCPHCHHRFGPQIPEVEVGARGFCPMCDWNLIWDGKKWIAGDRDKNWERR